MQFFGSKFGQFHFYYYICSDKRILFNHTILYYEEISYPRTGAGIDTGWLQKLLSTTTTC